MECYIEDPWSSKDHPHTNRDPLRLLGGHMEYEDPDQWWYILPICPGHNSKKFDRNADGGVMTTNDKAFAVKITPYKTKLS